jgi:hypothetical protein
MAVVAINLALLLMFMLCLACLAVLPGPLPKPTLRHLSRRYDA